MPEDLPMADLAPPVEMKHELALPEEDKFSKLVAVSSFESYVEMAMKSDLFKTQHQVKFKDLQK